MIKTLKAIVKWLSGKKTYIVGAGSIIYALGIKLGYWPSDPDLWGTLFGTSAITLRLAIAKMAIQVVDDSTK